jgi:hypothetical protein
MSKDKEIITNFNEEDEPIYEDILIKAFMAGYPNPNRKGCLDPKLLCDAAFKRINKEQFFAVVEHLAKCSPCAREARLIAYFAEEFEKIKRLLIKGTEKSGEK